MARGARTTTCGGFVENPSPFCPEALRLLLLQHPSGFEVVRAEAGKASNCDAFSLELARKGRARLNGAS